MMPSKFHGRMLAFGLLLLFATLCLCAVGMNAAKGQEAPLTQKEKDGLKNGKEVPLTQEEKDRIAQGLPPKSGKIAKLGGPKDDALYVWQQPDRGYQSVIILKATKPDTLECGLLVPITLKFKDIEAVPGKEAEVVEALNKEAVGRLLTAALAGRTGDGATWADLWAGSEKGWLSEILLDSKLYRKKGPTVTKTEMPPAKK